MRALLDVSTLLALMDPNHAHHGRARRWFREECDDGWASCAITENGFIRIFSQPAYLSAVPIDAALASLDDTCHDSDHEYWPCDITLRDPQWIDRGSLLGHRQLTDIYLLALATSRGGRFVTFDRAITRAAVPPATAANLVVL